MAWRRAKFARRHAIVISRESLGRYDAVDYERQVAQGA
jgi:hypothetical protein